MVSYEIMKHDAWFCLVLPAVFILAAAGRGMMTGGNSVPVVSFSDMRESRSGDAGFAEAQMHAMGPRRPALDRSGQYPERGRMGMSARVPGAGRSFGVVPTPPSEQIDRMKRQRNRSENPAKLPDEARRIEEEGANGVLGRGWLSERLGEEEKGPSATGLRRLLEEEERSGLRRDRDRLYPGSKFERPKPGERREPLKAESSGRY